MDDIDLITIEAIKRKLYKTNVLINGKEYADKFSLETIPGSSSNVLLSNSGNLALIIERDITANKDTLMIIKLTGNDYVVYKSYSLYEMFYDNKIKSLKFINDDKNIYIEFSSYTACLEIDR